MGKSRSSFEVIILIAALAVCIGAIGWFAGWWGGDPDPAPGPKPTKVTPSEAAPAIALQQLRREGSRFDCYAMGRIHGDVLTTGKLKAYRMKLGEAREKATWLAPWTVHFTSTIEKNDGKYLEESRSFHEVRFLRALAPPDLVQLDYKLDPKVNKALVSLAGKLAMAPEAGSQAGSVAAMAVIAGQKYDYANVAKIFGVDEKILAPQANAIHGAAAVADAFEGQTVLISSKNNRVRWFHAPDAPRDVIETMERASTPIDYGPLASIELEVGEQRVISNQVINDMFPPDMRKELFENNDVVMQLRLVRSEDEVEHGRTHAVLNGDGILTFRTRRGATTFEATITKARALIDVTDPDGRFLHLLELTVPIEASVLAKRKWWYDVNFDGDLEMELSYRVNKLP